MMTLWKKKLSKPTWPYAEKKNLTRAVTADCLVGLCSLVHVLTLFAFWASL